MPRIDCEHCDRKDVEADEEVQDTCRDCMHSLRQLIVR